MKDDEQVNTKTRYVLAAEHVPLNVFFSRSGLLEPHLTGQEIVLKGQQGRSDQATPHTARTDFSLLHCSIGRGHHCGRPLRQSNTTPDTEQLKPRGATGIAWLKGRE